MADLPVNAPNLLLDKDVRHFREFGTILAEADAPVVRPELAKLSTENRRQ